MHTELDLSKLVERTPPRVFRILRQLILTGARYLVAAPQTARLFDDWTSTRRRPSSLTRAHLVNPCAILTVNVCAV